MRLYVRFILPHEKARPQCGRILPDTEFHRNKRRPDGLSFYCKSCAAERSGKSRRKRGIAPKKRAASGVHSYCKPCHNARGKETVERLYGTSRHYHLTRRYGVGEKEFAELPAEQGGVCAICGAANTQHLDHDHRTGWVRGILCFNCNGGLGQAATTRAI